MKSLVDSDDRDVICVFPFLPRPKSMHRHDGKCNDPRERRVRIAIERMTLPAPLRPLRHRQRDKNVKGSSERLIMPTLAARRVERLTLNFRRCPAELG
jgi:hypothetical protein